MKVLACGSRTMPAQYMELILKALLEVKPTLVIQGEAKGADLLAKACAVSLNIPVECFPADWGKHGKAAGHIRNQQMLDFGPDLVIAFYPVTGITPGTKDMVRRAIAKGIPVKHVTYGAP